MKELIHVVYDNDKRRQYVEKLLREALSNEGLIIEPILKWKIDEFDLDIHIWYEPFTFGQEQLNEMLSKYVEAYKSNVRGSNLAAYGKEQITAKDVFGDEFHLYEHLVSPAIKSDGCSNDNSDACIIC